MNDIQSNKPSLNRRQFVAGASAVALVPLISSKPAFAETQTLPPLGVIDARTTHAFQLTAMEGVTDFFPAVPSPTMGFNQAYLGPVLRLRSGTSVQATVKNATQETITSHWHGLLVPGEVDGGPHNAIPPGGMWQPVLAIDQPPATLWYHTHVHGETARRVYSGLAGVLIVDDGLDDERGLPTTYGEDDLVLVVQDKRFDAAGFTAYDPTPADKFHGFLGNTIVVNGVPSAMASVPRGIVRLRLLNASNARNFELFFDDGRLVHLIASDQGFLPAPVPLQRVRLTPGERVELLVDFTAGGTVRLMGSPHDEGGTEMGGMAGMPGMAPMPPLQDSFSAPFDVVAFQVDAAIPARIGALPRQILGGESPRLADPSQVREVLLNDMGMLAGDEGAGAMPGMNHGPAPGPAGGLMMPGMSGVAGAEDPVFGINGRPFDMARIDFEVAQGSIERWIVSGQHMGHPFHIHGARFMVVSEGGGAPRPENAGWKDTVFVSRETELLVEFRHPASGSTPFMFHCHVLEHEDRGMMGQLVVAASAARQLRFELVGEVVRDGPTVRFSIGLVDAESGAIVTDAAIRAIEFNMEPEGMGGMVNAVTQLPVTTPGVQPMEVVPDMSGRWQVILEATIPGGAEPITGRVIIRVPN